LLPSTRALRTGPSPRGWGELAPDGRGAAAERTIPTRVGRTMVGHLWPFVVTDHPHAGGENVFDGPVAHGQGGPSPRGWGEPEQARAERVPRRTIPTRVGRTAAGQACIVTHTDHPHAGGENVAA